MRFGGAEELGAVSIRTDVGGGEVASSWLGVGVLGTIKESVVRNEAICIEGSW